MVFSRWPIKQKLRLGVFLLIVMLFVLAYSGLAGVYAYRQLVRQISQRADELPLITSLTSSLNSLHQSLTPVLRNEGAWSFTNSQQANVGAIYWADFQFRLLDAHRDARIYRDELGNDEGKGIADRSKERETVEEIIRRLGLFESIDERALFDVDIRASWR